jgi:hypothetical protein
MSRILHSLRLPGRGAWRSAFTLVKGLIVGCTLMACATEGPSGTREDDDDETGGTPGEGSVDETPAEVCESFCALLHMCLPPSPGIGADAQECTATCAADFAAHPAPTQVEGMKAAIECGCACVN